MNKNLRKTRKNAVRHLKNKKTSSKLYSKKDSSAIRTTHPPANSTKVDSEAILPNQTQLVFLGVTSLRENGLSQQEKQFSKTNLLRKCGLLVHTSAAFLKNCCTEKLFRCLWLGMENQPANRNDSHLTTHSIKNHTSKTESR